MVAAPRLAATSRLEQVAMSWSSSAMSAMFTYITHLSKLQFRSHCSGQVNGVYARDERTSLPSDLLAWWTSGQSDTTRTLTQVWDQLARRYPAGLQQVSDQLAQWTLGLS